MTPSSIVFLTALIHCSFIEPVKRPPIDAFVRKDNRKLNSRPTQHSITLSTSLNDFLFDRIDRY